jgi:subtilisin family serine protease
MKTRVTTRKKPRIPEKHDLFAGRLRGAGAAVLILVFLSTCPACRTKRSQLTISPRSPALPERITELREAEGKFEQGFLDRLRNASDNDRFGALVDLSRQLDLRAFTGRPEHALRDKRSRRAAVIGALEEIAGRQQARLGPILDEMIEDGRLDYVRPVSIVNRLVVEGRAAGILELAESPEVSGILPDWVSKRRRGRHFPGPSASPPLGDSFRSWAIAALGADRLWAQGLVGDGVVVGIIDTGVFADHEQLQGGQLEGSRGWYDPVRATSTPYDSHGHGTSVLSLAVGTNPEGRIVGVAPGARWTAALGNYDNFYSRIRMTLAADWMLRVARPDVLINAWSHDEGDCNDFDLPFIDAWLAAEIFPVFPAGNQGPGPGTGDSPANLFGVLPDSDAVFSVASITSRWEVAPESSRGPSRCGSPQFPTLGAPGSDVPCATLGSPNAYRLGSGTSFAAGLTAGAAALLLQADPELSPHELRRILVSSARDLPPAGPDDASGAGAIDLVSALQTTRPKP